MALRAGSVGPVCEVGLGPSRGWRSRRAASPPRRLPSGGAARGASLPSPLPATGSGARPPRPPLGVAVGGVPRWGSGRRAGPRAGGRLYARRPTAGRARGGRAVQRRRLWTCAGPFSRISQAMVRAGTPVPPPSPGPPPGGSRARVRGGGLPGAVPRPAPSSRLRTGADKGNPTV